MYPPLEYPLNYFNLIFGISVFTHLSKESHDAWSQELYRITAPDGIVILTTHGDAFKVKLTMNELKEYEYDELVIRSKVKEGYRMFGAFQPPSFMKKVFEKTGFIVLQHNPGSKKSETYISQDVWILRKL